MTQKRSAGCALAQRRNMSQVTALGARMRSDSVKNMSAYADQNHAPSFTDVRLELSGRWVMKSERKEAKNEEQWDKLLHTHTTGRDDSKADQFRYPYEPTPYSVLQRLANGGLIRKGDTLIDYGCGKGRVDFFLSYQTKCHTIGVEYDERLYEKAMENRAGAVSSGRVSFELVDAVQFPVPAQVDCAYFFNPFSLEILQKVIARLLESYYACPRKIRLFFYYPSDEYISYLMSVDELMFVDEIPCMDLFEGNNPRERIVIFEVE
mgnify:FL=1